MMTDPKLAEPQYTIGVLSQTMNPPKPVGLDVMADRKFVGTLTVEQVREALAQWDRLSAARAEPGNEHARRLTYIGGQLRQANTGDKYTFANDCDAAAAEIERLAADRDSWQKQAEIQAESLRESNAEVERLAMQLSIQAALNRDLRSNAEHLQRECLARGSEVERLAARVRELEEKLGERAMDWQREYASNPPESKPDQETKGER